jgi:starch synthase
MEGKAICKAVLQERFGLKFEPKTPLFGIISASRRRKDSICSNHFAARLGEYGYATGRIGNGRRADRSVFNDLARRFPGRVGVYIGFSVELSHLVEAGSDFFLMPSIYEPCGLNQSYSMRYGTLPIVRATGGLDDTVHQYDEKPEQERASNSGT